jgi:acyl-CoA hydrolase
MSSLMLPSDANPMGNVHGGEVLKLIDTAAGVAARRHVRGPVVTARLDDMSFLHPVYIGNLLTVKASVNCTWHTSLEVGVRVEAEDLQSGERWHVASAYLILVGLGTDGRPTSVPPVLPVTSDEVRRYHGAVQRRTQRDARLQRRG